MDEINRFRTEPSMDLNADPPSSGPQFPLLELPLKRAVI